MALLGAYVVPNSAAVRLSTLIPSTVKQVDIKSNPGNAAVVYLGPSTVTTAGVNAWVALDAGESFGLNADGGDQLQLNAADVYIIATTTDKVHISYVL